MRGCSFEVPISIPVFGLIQLRIRHLSHIIDILVSHIVVSVEPVARRELRKRNADNISSGSYCSCIRWSKLICVLFCVMCNRSSVGYSLVCRISPEIQGDAFIYRLCSSSYTFFIIIVIPFLIDREFRISRNGCIYDLTRVAFVSISAYISVVITESECRGRILSIRIDVHHRIISDSITIVRI